DPSCRSDRGTKRKKLSKEAESSRDSRSKEKKSSSTSKDASQTQHKHSGKSAHAEEPSHIVDDSGVQQDQEFDTGNNDEQPADTEVSKAYCQVARAKEPRTLFDKLMDTSFDFSAFVLNRLNITYLTQEILVGPAFELLKGTCKSLIELEYHLEECSKATTERLDWHNPEGKPYPFDLNKPLPLIRDHRGRQVIPQDFFINNDLEYLKGRDLSRRYSTSVTKIKAATYKIKWIEDLVRNLSSLVSPVKVIYDQYAYWEQLTNLTIDERYDLNVALRMFTRRIFIQRRVEDLQLGVKSYQKKLNLTKLDIFRSNIRNMTTYTAYSDPKGVIYKDQMNRNRLMRVDELHKFSDGMLDDVWSALNDIAKGIRMEYLPKRKWSGLDK
ncbi:hypothetical protein Tco_1294866, partial [Tanacetum coccineum]